MSADETYIDVTAVRALAIAHDRSAAVLGACARAVEHCSFAAQQSGPTFSEQARAVDAGYEAIGRALEGWASSTAALAAGIAGAAVHAETAEQTAADTLRNLS